MRSPFSFVLAVLLAPLGLTGAEALDPHGALPTALSQYQDPVAGGLWAILAHRVQVDPFNLVALLIFFCAIVHTFFCAKLRHLSHEVERRHSERLREKAALLSSEGSELSTTTPEVSFLGQLLHFFGEIEAVFGIWVIVLAAAITWFKSWDSVVGYIGNTVSYTEPLFIVIIMTLAATRPVLGLAEACLKAVASLGKGTPTAWWLSILIISPLLGSLITEPAAMTIGALLLSRQFYALRPSARLSYATIGLLFVNISVGGTLTHFAAPPVIMVAAPWKWDLLYMLSHFGWRAVLGICLSTGLYFMVFKKELLTLRIQSNDTGTPAAEQKTVPSWITLVQLGFLAFTVWQAHHPVMFIGAFLFFLAFSQATAHHQDPIELRSPILVGFFLAGLVIHGGLQAWWIEPILGRLTETPLFLSAMVLTAFNDNAAITYLATLVPSFTETLKYSVVAGAVVGGGLTVIANAPNPAGQAILAKFFPDGISPLKLLLAAIPPSLVMLLCFIF